MTSQEADECMHDLDDIVDQAFIARYFRALRTAVNNWTTRYSDFPKPLNTPGVAHPLYSLEQVKYWYVRKWGYKKYESQTGRKLSV